MTDDDILFLWTLNGSWGWKRLSGIIRIGNATQQWHAHPMNCIYPFYLCCRDYTESNFIDFYTPPETLIDGFLSQGIEILYHVVDPVTFSPSEPWLKILLARHWYSKNKEQFT